jgi:hypothetical protein
MKIQRLAAGRLGTFVWSDERAEWRGVGLLGGIEVTTALVPWSKERRHEPALLTRALIQLKRLDKNERLIRWKAIQDETCDAGYFDSGEEKVSALHFWSYLRPAIVKLGAAPSIYFENRRLLGYHYLVAELSPSGAFLSASMEG